MREFNVLLITISIVMLLTFTPSLTVTVDNPNVLKADNTMKFRWGNVSMIEVTVDLKFTVVDATQYEFYIPNSWSIDSALSSTENKLYKIYFLPFDPLNPKPNELVITFKYDIYVAPPETSTPYNFNSRAILNTPEVRDMPPEMKDVANELFSHAETYYEVIYRATDFTSNYITYDSNQVTRDLTVSQIWSLRKGVCRHYAEFEKALLNYAGVQAFYAMGFLVYGQNDKKQVIPHAWLLVYDPVNGWFPIDPTNHNFEHQNNFLTGVVYPFDLLVETSKEYKATVDYPIRGELTINNVQSTFDIVNVKPLKYLTVYEYRLPNGFSFISVDGAGMLIYRPLKQVFTDNSPISDYKFVSDYEDSIVEYVPAGYLVPIGFEPYNSRVFLHYYFDVQPKVVDLNASVFTTKEGIVFSGLPRPLYLTDVHDNYVPAENINGNQVWPFGDAYVRKSNNRYYIPIFGIWYYIPMVTSDIKNVTIEPVAVYTENGVKYFVVKIETDPDIDGAITNYLVTNYNVYKVLGNNTYVLSGTGNTLELKLGDKSFTFKLTRANYTKVKIKSLTANVSTDYTTFNLTIENLKDYLSTGMELPDYANINGANVKLYDIEHGEGWVSFKVPTSVGLLTNDFVITYLSTFSLGHSLLDPHFDVKKYTLTYDSQSLVKLTVWFNVTTWASVDADTLMRLFPDNIQTINGDGHNHEVVTITGIPVNLLKLTFNTVVDVLGQSVPLTVTVDNYNSLRVASVKIKSVSYSTDVVGVTFVEYFTSSKGVADLPTLILLRTKLKPFSIVNGVAVPYSDYYNTKNSLIATMNVPIDVLKKSSKIIVDGYALKPDFSVKVITDYTSPGLYIKGLFPVGGLECSVPFTLKPGEDDGSVLVALDVHEVDKTAVCQLNDKTYTIKPQYPGIVSMTLADTDRIDDVRSDGRGVYAGYDGVYITVTTTQPPAFGEYKLVIDNDTLISAKLTVLRAKLPELSVGEHKVKLYDGNFLVWEGTLTVYPQPIPLKLLHHWYLLLILAVLLVGGILTGVITTEPYVVTMAKKMFPNYEYIQHYKRGKWEAVIMYDPMTGNYLYVYFYDKRFQSVATYKP